MMSPEAKKKIQLALMLALVVATLRAGYILYQRHEDRVAVEKQKQAQNVGYSNPDYYVNPKKLHPYDLKSAKQLTEQPVWVKEGYRYTIYRYDPSREHVDFSQEAGLLLPLEKLQIKDVVTAAGPGSGDKRQVMAVFERAGKTFAVPIGYEEAGQYKIYSDEMFFVEDPRDLYKHWPPDVWTSIEQHQVKPGMNELQADFAVGMGALDTGSSSNDRTLRYPNGGKPLVIEFYDGRAKRIEAGSTSP